MADHLMEIGAMSAGVEEFQDLREEEQQIFGDSGAVWDRCIVHGLFSSQPDMQSIQEQLGVLTEGRPLQFEAEHIQDQEWLESIRHSYQPAQIDKGLWIIPSWCQPEDASAINIVLEPGIAFGTGDHPTTRLCLKALLGLDLQGKTVVDYGTGSGVLAIAALKLGAAQAYGTDTDALAVRAAAQNVALNAMEERFQAVQCEASTEGPEPLAAACGPAPVAGTFDVVMANILQGPLLELQGRLCMYARPGGKIVLSGFLEGQWPAIRAAYENDCHDFQVRQEDQWLAVTCSKRDDFSRPSAH
ncbi:g2709 [Coccomyxa viridis]|uniref:ETFB lysine methyltransferase n=1 Tax=Coccomyxa viridis TaxID=1274662 RepID=A0ABP1FR93_9CHLO